MSLSLFCKELTVLDYAYWNLNKGPIGDSLYVDVELFGSVDKEFVIFDFSRTKKTIKSIIDGCCDHRLLITKNLTEEVGEDLQVDHMGFYYKAPRQAFCLIEGSEINMNSIQNFLEKKVFEGLPENVEQIKITLRQEIYPKGQSHFHYTHGLKLHDGNCQRLLHGHHNIVEVFQDGKKSEEMESYISQELFHANVHFVFKENIIEETQDQIHIKYKSKQGVFELKLPKKFCYIFESETTVENLAKEFYHLVKLRNPNSKNILVRAYEGINKGASYS